MKDSTRRIVLFVIVVGSGSILVLFDIPAIVMVVGIIALSILVLFINGSIHLPRIAFKKQSTVKIVPATTGNARKKSKKEKRGLFFHRADTSGKTSPAPGSKSAQKPGSGLFKELFLSMSRAFSVLASDISRAGKSGREKELQKNKIDRMLDGSVVGKISDIRSLREANPEMIPASKKMVEDPFTTLVKEPMNTELLDSTKNEVDTTFLNDINLGEESETPSLGDDISHLDVALDTEEEKITIDDESDDEVASILAAHQDELEPGEGTDAAPGIASEINNLEELDIGTIDLDEELDIEDTVPEPEESEGIKISEKTSPQVEKEKTTAGEAMGEKPKEMGESMIAFSTGKGVDDDLMSSLKSDASKTKKESHTSLLRELKDIKVPVHDLEEELEGLLTLNKTKK